MKTPRILSGPHGKPALCKSALIELSTGNSPNVHTFPITIGSMLIDDGSDGLRHLEAADASIAYIVDGIVREDGLTPKRNQYLTVDECNTAGHKLAVFPVGGLLLEIEEDGDGGGITDAALAAGTVYYDLIVAAPTDYEEAEDNEAGVGRAYPSIKIDSSSGASSTSGKVIEVLGVERVNGAVNSSIRVFRCKVIDSAAQFTQP